MTSQQKSDRGGTSIVVVGMQWGDEGKGKIVDLICPAFDGVVRYQGGNNAGHTVKFGQEHYSLHLIPSGILHPGQHCYLGNGMVIDPKAFLDELQGLIDRGVDVEGRVHLSDRAQVLTGLHSKLDWAREEARGNAKIGTTAKGIGPAYETKIARDGIRVGELISKTHHRQLDVQLRRVNAELELLGAGEEVDRAEIEATLEDLGKRLEEYVCDVSAELARVREAGGALLFEGAQGALLDIDHGTYPFVTSSPTSAAGACTGAGVPPSAIGGVLGILKAYTTRVGEGPFPTELHDATGEHLRERGHEFGTTTGRPRRCGWLDLVAARYAQRLNGAEAIALTKLDVLDEVDEILICDAYEIDGETVTDFPSRIDQLERAKPVYRAVPGWNESTVGALEISQLPPAARSYVELIEEALGTHVAFISTGPRREETIVRDTPLRDWFGAKFDDVLKARGA